MAADLWRLKLGSVTAAVLDADANALVGGWDYGRWIVGTPALYQPYTERTLGLDGKFKTVGGIQFSWSLNINQAQYAWFISAFFANNEQSVDVTAKTYDMLGATWRTVQCTMHRPGVADIDAVADYWLRTWTLQFTLGSIAPAS